MSHKPRAGDAFGWVDCPADVRRCWVENTRSPCPFTPPCFVSRPSEGGLVSHRRERERECGRHDVPEHGHFGPNA